MWTIRISNGVQIFLRLHDGLPGVRILLPQRDNTGLHPAPKQPASP